MLESKRCAACKYLRRRCPKDCIFSPYFPSKDIDRFVCVHKIFGASNVSKMLEQVAEEKRRDAAESMIWEARARVRDPIHGVVGIITQLRQQIMDVEYELVKTQALVALFNAQQQHQQQQQQQLCDLQFDNYLQLGFNPQETTSHYLEDPNNVSRYFL